MPFRIILADDHVVVRQSVGSLLEREGFEIVGEANDGQELIHLAAKQNAGRGSYRHQYAHLGWLLVNLKQSLRTPEVFS